MGPENNLIQGLIESSHSLCLHRRCLPEPASVPEVIGADVVLIESCETRPKEDTRGLGRSATPFGRIPDRIKNSGMGHRQGKVDPAKISRPGLECLRLLKRKRPELPVVMFSHEADLLVCMRCFLVGADGYLVLPGTSESFERLIQEALQGWKPFSKEIQRLMAERLAWYSLRGRAAELTRTEAELLWCFANGLANKDISDLRSVSPSTVHSLTCNIFKKLKVNRRGDAVRAVLRF